MICLIKNRWINKLGQTQTYRKKDRQTEGKTEKQTERRMDRRTGRRVWRDGKGRIGRIS